MRIWKWMFVGIAVVAVSTTVIASDEPTGAAVSMTAIARDEPTGEMPPAAPVWTNPVEAAYTAIWDGFYGPGKGKLLLKAWPKLLPDGKPAFDVDPKTDLISLEIFLDVDTEAFEVWRQDAHQRLDELGSEQCRPVPLDTPNARIIGGRAFMFCEEGEACVQRWEKGPFAIKTAVAVRVEGFSKKGKPLGKWEAPLRLFTRGEKYVEFPCPLRKMNRLLDIPQSIWKWTGYKRGVPTVKYERASFLMALPRLSTFRAESIATITCTIIDEADFMPDLVELAPPEILSLENELVDVPGTQYAIGRHEVSQALWATIMGKNASANPSSFLGTNLPVDSVTWDDCQLFIEKLNSRAIIRLRGQIYKLPSEEEWEYACKAGANGAYCLTTNGTEVTAESLGTVAWFVDNSEKETHPIGEKEPNAFGLYDMHGNVWEWTSTEEETDRIIKGGGWNGDAIRCESSNRNRYHPAHGNPYLGFRLLRKTVDPR